MKTDFYKKAFGHDIYAVTCPEWAPTALDGGAIMESWIVVGSEKTLAMDSGVPRVSGFREYLEEEFGRPVLMLNTHGHWDHTGCNSQFDCVWLNASDWPLLLMDADANPIYENTAQLPYKLCNIEDGDILDLGGRKLRAIRIQGHTKGSIMLYDITTKSLFSGDSVARRILYGLMDWTPLSQYIDSLRALSDLEIDAIYSMHDPFALPGDLPARIIRNLRDNIETTTMVWELPGSSRKFLRILLGENEANPGFFDFVMPFERRAEAAAQLTIRA